MPAKGQRFILSGIVSQYSNQRTEVLPLRVSEVVKLRPDDIDIQRKDKHRTIRTVQKIFEIQELLGHKSSKTTEIYIHVSTRDIGKIKSPLDSLKVGKRNK